jgi:hypothetical protein
MEQLATISLFWMLDLVSPFLALDEKYLEVLVNESKTAIQKLPDNPTLGRMDWVKSWIWSYPSVRYVSDS